MITAIEVLEAAWFVDPQRGNAQHGVLIKLKYGVVDEEALANLVQTIRTISRLSDDQFSRNVVCMIWPISHWVRAHLRRIGADALADRLGDDFFEAATSVLGVGPQKAARF